MNFKNLYTKFRMNKPLTDNELKFVIKQLTTLECMLDELGIEYRLVSNSIKQELNHLNSYLFYQGL